MGGGMCAHHQVYQQAIRMYQLAGPTFFSEVGR